MKTVAVLAALVGSSSAFTSTPAFSGSATSKTALQDSVFDKYVGAQDFRGAEFKFDPVSGALLAIAISNDD